MVKDRTQPLGAVLTVRPERLEWGGGGGGGGGGRGLGVDHLLSITHSTSQSNRLYMVL